MKQVMDAMSAEIDPDIQKMANLSTDQLYQLIGMVDKNQSLSLGDFQMNVLLEFNDSQDQEITEMEAKGKDIAGIAMESLRTIICNASLLSHSFQSSAS